MGIFELIVLAVGLSMDAFAVAISLGLTLPKTKSFASKALLIGLYFGFFQAVMPLIGFLISSLFSSYIIAFDHWVAFALLSLIGGKMIGESLKKEDEEASDNAAALTPARMLPLAVATSIDALAVGVSFAFLQVAIIPAVSIIGVITLVLSMIGVKIGNIFGARFKSKAELAGGIVLVLIGLKILLEHLGLFEQLGFM
jgi:putative Mn2+ efflux pump MntP